MFGPCFLSRQRGSMLLGMLAAAALGALVTAWALSALGAVDQSARGAAKRLERRQQAGWVLRLMAKDLARHRRFGCGAQPWLAQDFAVGHWTLSLPGRRVPHRKLKQDTQQQLSEIELEPQTPAGWQAWPQSLLSSCAATVPLAGGAAQWLGNGDAPGLRLTPALPLQEAAPSGGLHLPSLQLWLPLERHYQVRSGRLLAWDKLGGVAAGGERVLLDGVMGVSLTLQARAGCALGAGWQTLAAQALNGAAAQLLAAARLELAWRPDPSKDEVETLGRDVALTPLACGGGT
ncbi:hypothetical protein [Chromobacterium alticapitis]|uniref:hypothetical protein n=1 Tax=Chromobacterium alticapitis TaxID=2073169 RepID=UPI0011B09E76|nr:hypothetical protein [Chromobacterium alticapitis]